MDEYVHFRCGGVWPSWLTHGLLMDEYVHFLCGGVWPSWLTHGLGFQVVFPTQPCNLTQGYGYFGSCTSANYDSTVYRKVRISARPGQCTTQSCFNKYSDETCVAKGCKPIYTTDECVDAAQRMGLVGQEYYVPTYSSRLWPKGCFFLSSAGPSEVGASCACSTKSSQKFDRNGHVPAPGVHISDACSFGSRARQCHLRLTRRTTPRSVLGGLRAYYRVRAIRPTSVGNLCDCCLVCRPPSTSTATTRRARAIDFRNACARIVPRFDSRCTTRAGDAPGPWPGRLQPTHDALRRTFATRQYAQIPCTTLHRETLHSLSHTQRSGLHLRPNALSFRPECTPVES